MAPLDVGSLILCDGDGDGGGTALPSDHDDDPYAPAESLRLRIGQDIDWSDVVAVLERDDSTKGAGANPKCAARRSAARTSLSAPAPRAAAVVIGGLPGKAAREHGRRRAPCQLQLGGRVASRVFASGEPAAGHQAGVSEPGSPKVSCLGGVRSQPAEGIRISTTGRRCWAWLVADVMLMSCCWSGRRDSKPRRSKAE